MVVLWIVTVIEVMDVVVTADNRPDAPQRDPRIIMRWTINRAQGREEGARNRTRERGEGARKRKKPQSSCRSHVGNGGDYSRTEGKDKKTHKRECWFSRCRSRICRE